jgi:hypothetical protein
MGRMKSCLATLVAAGTLAAQPVAAQSLDQEAEALRRLDIMLMVTSLRCRFGADDFLADYQRFTARHLPTLNAASRQMNAGYALRHGERAARRHLDTISTMMANEYGQGHPWLDCAALGVATRRLTASAHRSELVTAAQEMLAAAPSPARATLVAGYRR